MMTHDVEAGTNPPLAFRMAVIAAINQNVAIACIFGSFSALLASAEARLGIGRELSTLAISAVTVVMAVCAPLVGTLAGRGSLKRVMLAGSALSTMGYVLLATTASFPLYLIAYGLFLGPGLATGAILPSALVTRWFTFHRGRALGIVCAPILIAIIPLAATQLLAVYGLPATYMTLAAVSAVALLANFLIVEDPESSGATAIGGHGGSEQAGGAGIRAGSVVKSARFWALSFGFIATSNGSVILTAHMIPMATSWGISTTLAATLLSIECAVGIVGTLLAGVVADRLGGARALLVIVASSCVLWALLLLKPDFMVAAVLMGLIGLNGSGVIPTLGVAFSEAFGREGFAPAYGLCNFVNMPFSALCVPAAAMVFARSGSYSGAIAVESGFLALTGVALIAFALSRAPRSTGVADIRQAHSTGG